MAEGIRKYILNWKFLVLLYALLVVFATWQASAIHKQSSDRASNFTKHNNYLIFKNAHQHLKANTDLYIAYPQEYWDLYKYSPSFAVLFAPFSYLPDTLGLGLWNALNAFALLLAIYYLPFKSRTKPIFLALALAVEMLTSIQNQQSNALMSALMIAAFVLMERNKLFWAAGLLMLSVYIKLFGIVAFVMFLFYPNKIKAALYSIFWLLFLFAIPLLSVDLHSLWQQYINWGALLAMDHQGSLGFSVMGWLNSWFHLNPDKNILLLSGAAILVAPLVRFRQWQNQKYRFYYLSSVLIWVVIFNHKAESPTFVIAMAGALIWFFNASQNTLEKVLLVLALVLTSLSPTDLFPAALRNSFFVPYAIKAVPMIFIWIYIQVELWRNEFGVVHTEDLSANYR